ncbi:MAG: PBP1A family penicillin-binding protein [Paenibacillus dendritiformis]|uniref:transglycosylase domain-containing protein n=1 Tax=Paenibacillus dendritiformis TaxID=130049 RepID=UPI001B20F61C|nr:PBP1A family penicillin-binding protein [Paenibacillus dendritiformis]MDU5140685.1 PBP1A family penicillin-binding protein [Paenibacillus dendritiformis]GIO70994.1 penicillin-binding protein 1F [Paenibacillus dendritiformis]
MTREKQPPQRTRTRTPVPTKGKGKGKPPKKRGKWSWRKTFWLSFFMAAFAAFIAVGGYLFILLNGERLMREYKDADMFEMAEISTVYDSNNNVIAHLGKGIEHREIAEPEDIPQRVRDAFIATEDRRFNEHRGVDLWSIGRAMVKDIVSRSLAEGGSTITQQLAKNMFLTSDKTIFRKATEVSIALALENHFTKDEILTMYLNRIFFGKRAYGIIAASKTYFGTEDLNKLELWQIATLAAIPKAPTHYNPINNPERSKERRQVVLQLMYEQGYITAQERDEASAVDYVPVESKDEGAANNNNEEPYYSYLDYMVEEIVERTGLTEDQLFRGGYQIYTTLDSNAQRIMYDAFNNDEMFEKSKDETKVQGAMVITDHKTGAILAMMGGRDYARKGLNRATIKRQPGSAFKPIVSYAPALETGKWFPWSKLSNEKQCFNGYCPTNLGGYTTSVDMKEAVRRSINIPAVWLLNEIKLKTGFEFAKSLGIPLTNDDLNLSIALGGMTHGVTPIDMATAYNAFANGGNYYPSYAVAKIVDRKGHDYFTYHVPKPVKVMSEQSAYYMTEMLTDVVKSGTGTQAQISGRQVAGKTGTTQHSVPGYDGPGDRDAWFVGYTPEWSAAVWMGYDKTDRDHVLHESSRVPSRMFSEVVGKALKDRKSGSFNKPDHVEKQPDPVQKVSGLTASYSETTKTVSLSWQPVQGDNIVYNLYRKSSAEQDYTKLLAGLKVTNAEDIGVFAGETYSYVVTAVSGDDESARSNAATVKIEEEEIQIPETPETPEPPNVDPPDQGGDPDGSVDPFPPDPDGSDPSGGWDDTGTVPGTVVPDQPEPPAPPDQNDSFEESDTGQDQAVPDNNGEGGGHGFGRNGNNGNGNG